MKFLAYLRSKPLQRSTAPPLDDEHVEATVRVIHWPPGYFDKPVRGNFIEASIPYTIGANAMGWGHEPTPGHLALQVLINSDSGAEEEYYLSIGPDKEAIAEPNIIEALRRPLESYPIAYSQNLAGDIRGFQGRKPIIKRVEFVNAERVANFIVKFNKINDSLAFLKEARELIDFALESQKTVAEARKILADASVAYDNSCRSLDDAAQAAKYLFDTGQLAESEYRKIDFANAQHLTNPDPLHARLVNLRNRLRNLSNQRSKLNHQRCRDLEIIAQSLDEHLKEIYEAAGSDAFYSLMAGGHGAPNGRSCVSVVSDGLCCGDIKGDFKKIIESTITLPTPAQFMLLVRGEIETEGDVNRVGRERSKSG